MIQFIIIEALFLFYYFRWDNLNYRETFVINKKTGYEGYELFCYEGYQGLVALSFFANIISAGWFLFYTSIPGFIAIVIYEYVHISEILNRNKNKNIKNRNKNKNKNKKLFH